jgi:GNAT superfamily N-acetyltransferase
MPSFQIVSHQEQPIPPQAIQTLYASVNWWPERMEEEIASVLQQAPAIGAWDGERLVGFARAISDQRFHAYIDDVVVHPAYQRLGIGQLVLERLLRDLQHIQTITLFCHAELIPFYESSGFQAFPSQKIMHLRRIENNA